MFCRTVCIVTQDYHAFIKSQNQEMIVKFQCKPVEFYLPFMCILLFSKISTLFFMIVNTSFYTFKRLLTHQMLYLFQLNEAINMMNNEIMHTYYVNLRSVM